MTIAQGINKQTRIKKQTALGTPATGASAQILRRRTSVFQLNKASFENDEIASHQQSSGARHGMGQTQGRISGLLSPGTYASLFQALLRKDFAATSAMTSLSITIAGAGPYTLTDGANDFLADGLKIGDVVRLTAGSFTAGNLNKNLVVTNVTATVVTVVVLNGSTLTTEGPIASATLTVVGKKSIVPTSSHTDDIFTVEEWYDDINRSEVFSDTKVSSVSVSMPASGNCTCDFDLKGLSRTISGSENFTSPTAETTTDVLTAVQGFLQVNGSTLTNITGASISIDGQANVMGSVVASNKGADISRGKVKVSGQITGFFESHDLSTLFDNETAVSLLLVVAADNTAASDFVSFVLSKIKLGGDTPDDGETGITRTFPFTAEINGSGGAALANDKTIISIQDSDAA